VSAGTGWTPPSYSSPRGQLGGGRAYFCSVLRQNSNHSGAALAFGEVQNDRDKLRNQAGGRQGKGAE